jgi:putative ABC transport system ATP-binding protein
VMVTHDQKAADYATHELHLDKGVLVEQSAA